MKFLGMSEYYSKFIKGFAGMCVNMRKLLCKGVNFIWSEECEKEFIAIKNMLKETPKLKSFDPIKRTVLITDASMKGLGGVLQQKDGDKENVILFLSRSLRGAELRYSVIEREALAVHWAVKKLKNLLWGVKFEIRTDHKPLCQVFNTKGIDAILARISKWVVALQGYDFRVEYLPGARNSVADTLSRLVEQSDKTGFEDEIDEWVCAIESGGIKEDRWREECAKDEEFLKLSALLKYGWNKKVKGECEKYWLVKDQLAESGGLIFRGTRLVPPTTLREELLIMAHEGHFGMSKTKERLRLIYWWPGMDIQVEQVVKDCIPCCMSEKSQKPRVQPMVIRERPKKPWEEFAFDILGPVRANGESYAFVLVDLYSRWPEVKITNCIDTMHMIEFLKEVFGRDSWCHFD